MILIPKIIHQIWLWNRIPSEIIRCMDSWKKYNYDWEYKIWLQDELEDELSEDIKKTSKLLESLAAKTDIYRLALIYKFWGLYVDADILCYRNINPLCENINFIISEEWPWITTNALFGSMQGHRIIQNALSDYLKYTPHIKTYQRIPNWPMQLSEFIDADKNNIKIIDREYFFWEYWMSWKNIFWYNKKWLTRYGNHYYFSSWNKKKKIWLNMKRKLVKIPGMMLLLVIQKYASYLKYKYIFKNICYFRVLFLWK